MSSLWKWHAFKIFHREAPVVDPRNLHIVQRFRSTPKSLVHWPRNPSTSTIFSSFTTSYTSPSSSSYDVSNCAAGQKRSICALKSMNDKIKFSKVTHMWEIYWIEIQSWELCHPRGTIRWVIEISACNFSNMSLPGCSMGSASTCNENYTLKRRL